MDFFGIRIREDSSIPEGTAFLSTELTDAEASVYGVDEAIHGVVVGLELLIRKMAPRCVIIHNVGDDNACKDKMPL